MKPTLEQMWAALVLISRDIISMKNLGGEVVPFIVGGESLEWSALPELLQRFKEKRKLEAK